MEVTTFQMMYDSILDFRATADYVESEINRLGLSCDHNDVVQETKGRNSRDMWVSMKTVSHFNLGMSLELMLKLMVFLCTRKERIPPVHLLTELYDNLEDSTQQLLQEYYDVAKNNGPDNFQLIALRNASSPGNAFPKKRDLNILRQAFEYFDDDAQLYLKRYSYELVEKREWRHYISDISVFAEFISDVMDDIQNNRAIFCPPD